MAMQDIPDGLVGDLMAEIRQGAGNAIVSPVLIFARHPENKCLEFWSDPGTARITAVLGAVELGGNESAVPGEDGVGLSDASNFREKFAAEAPADFGKCAAFRIGKPEWGREVGAEDSILSDEVFTLEQEALIHKTANVGQQPRPLVVTHDEKSWYPERAILPYEYFDHTSIHGGV